jgi:hypothetical protein
MKSAPTLKLLPSLKAHSMQGCVCACMDTSLASLSTPKTRSHADLIPAKPLPLPLPLPSIPLLFALYNPHSKL